MFDIDMILEATKEDPRTYRDLNNYEEKRVSARELAMAATKVERALGYQDDKGRDINVKNARTHLDKALAELLSATQRASRAGVINESQSGSLKEFIKDCKELDTDDAEEMLSKLREIISNTNRWKVPMLTKAGEKMVSIASLVPNSSRPQPFNTTTGPERAAWIANSRGRNNADKRTLSAKIIDSKTEEKSYEKIKKVSQASQELRDGIRSGKIPEGTTLKSYLEKKEANTETPKNVNNLQALSTISKLEKLHIPTLREKPIEGCGSVKELVKKWSKDGVKPNGQIEIVHTGSTGGSNTVVITKSVVWIAGNYYQVPKNDLVTKAKGGIAVKDSPYKGYTKSVKEIDKKKHEDMIAKLQAGSRLTEEVIQESASLDWQTSLMDLNMNGVIGRFSKGKLVVSYKGKTFTMEKDFSDFPKELNKFRKQIITVFSNRNTGTNSARKYSHSSPNAPYYKQGHIEKNYIRSQTFKEEAFLEALKRKLKKEIIEG